MVVQWLGTSSSILGIHFHNWMLAAVGIIVLNVWYYLSVLRRQ